MAYKIEKSSTKYHGGKLHSFDYIMLHHTAGQSAGDMAIGAGLTGREVSFHYLVTDPDETKTVRIINYVPLDTAAWHAGKGNYKGITDMNYHSIGIEVSWLSRSKDDFDASQVDATAWLIAYIWKTKGKKVSVIAHKDYAPLRKNDIDKTFPWNQCMALANKYYIEMIGKPTPKPPVDNDIPDECEKTVLSLGDKGNCVKVLQSSLNKCKLGVTLKIDGDFGIHTKGAVRTFQDKYELRVDGICGPKTWKKLEQVI